VVAIHEEYTRREALLDEVRSGIYLSSLLVRDYLLDPSHITAGMHRQRLLRIRSSMTGALSKLANSGSEEERAAIGRLLPEMDAYWDTMDPIFEWTPGQKLAFSSLFLRRQVLPRRTTVLNTAEELVVLNEASFRQQQQKINRSIEDFRKYTLRTLSITIALGLLVSGASVLRLSRLEKRAEQAYLRTERAEQELRRLSQQLVQAQEEERRRISRELHDEVGQMLTALRFELGNLEAVRGGPDPEFREHMKDAKDLAEKTLRAVRNIAMGLRPSQLDDLGLGPALEWQSREFSRRTGIPVELQLEGLPADLPDAHRTCVYRVIQEALTNCARHSRAKNIRVAVHAATDLLSFTVQDDGVGFRPAPHRWTGFGLTGVEERVRELGGAVEIHSQPGRGTSLRAEIPLQDRAAALRSDT
jgi:signal transduction histidine kinase